MQKHLMHSLVKTCINVDSVVFSVLITVLKSLYYTYNFLYGSKTLTTFGRHIIVTIRNMISCKYMSVRLCSTFRGGLMVHI